MKKIVFIKNLQKILEKKISEKDNLEKNGLDSLKVLELMVFNDKNFKNININPDKISRCKKVGDLIRLYGKEIS
jgi:acyl carrier protein|tara:strand:+ start:798 stop:1019 length:222 start_codon:yes stop_codon:yes gene_type:complete